MQKPQFPNNLKIMSYFTCSPKRTFLFFTGLNILRQNTLGMSSLHNNLVKR